MGRRHASVMGQLGMENLFPHHSLGIRSSGALDPLASSEIAIKVSL